MHRNDRPGLRQSSLAQRALLARTVGLHNQEAKVVRKIIYLLGASPGSRNFEPNQSFRRKDNRPTHQKLRHELSLRLAQELNLGQYWMQENEDGKTCIAIPSTLPLYKAYPCCTLKIPIQQSYIFKICIAIERSCHIVTSLRDVGMAALYTAYVQ